MKKEFTEEEKFYLATGLLLYAYECYRVNTKNKIKPTNKELKTLIKTMKKLGFKRKKRKLYKELLKRAYMEGEYYGLD